MEYLWCGVALCIAVYVIYILFVSQTVNYTYPPGPKGWPIIGSVFDIKLENLHLSLAQMAKRYGDLFSINLLGRTIVVLNTPALIRKAMTSDEFGDIFANRPHSFVRDNTIIGRGTVLMDHNFTLKRRRKLLHKMINMYGEGVQNMEGVVSNELGHVIESLENAASPPVLEDILFPSIINIISIMMMGKRFAYDAEEIRLCVEVSATGIKLGNPGVDLVLRFIPFIRYIPCGFGRYYQEFQRLVEELFQHFYHAPKETFEPDVSRGLIDVLLKIQHDSRAHDEQCWIDDEDVKAIAFDIIGAGILTTRSSLLFFFLVILHQPEVAKDIQEEVDAVVGSGRLPCLKDRTSMPYTEACILETLRLNTQVPLSVPHCTSKDVTFEGYHLPANTMVFANNWYVHHEDALWEKPWDFRPERFLDETGTLLPPESDNRRNMMAFGVGRRSCVGENFAKSRIFLYVTTLLQRFNFNTPNTGELPPPDPRQFTGALILAPDRYKVVVETR